MITENILLSSRFLTSKWLIIILSTFVLFFALIMAVTKRKGFSYQVKIIYFYLIGATVFEMIAWSIIVLPFKIHQNHWVHNTFNIFEYSCLCFYFYHTINNKKIKEFIKFISIAGFILILGITFKHFEKINIIDTLSSSIGMIIIICFVLLHFYEILYTDKTENLLTYTIFWISSGILIYFTGYFFVNLFSDLLLFDKINVPIWYYSIYYILLIFFRIFLTMGLWFSTAPIQSNLSLK